MSPAFLAVGKNVRGSLQSAGVNAKASDPGDQGALGAGGRASGAVFVAAGVRGADDSQFCGGDALRLRIQYAKHSGGGLAVSGQRATSRRRTSGRTLRRCCRGWRRCPGVTNVATSIGLPLEGGPGSDDVTIPGRPHNERWETGGRSGERRIFSDAGTAVAARKTAEPVGRGRSKIGGGGEPHAGGKIFRGTEIRWGARSSSTHSMRRR